MLDWNADELSNIIWDEAGETDDHIVPYPEATLASEDSRKNNKWDRQVTNTKSSGRKALESEVEINGRKMVGSSKLELVEGSSASGFDMDSLPNLPVSNAAKTDQDPWDASVSSNLTEITKFDSSGVAQLNNDTEIFQSPYGGKEQGDFVDYGWANIGSFDDLDRMFSNDDTVFGNVTLGNADELWSSSKDVTNSPVTSIPLSVGSPSSGLGSLRSAQEPSEFGKDYVQDSNPPFTVRHEKADDLAPHSMLNAHGIVDHVESAGRKRKPIVKGQMNLNQDGKKSKASSQLTSEDGTSMNLESKVKQKKLLKNQKKLEERNEVKFYPENYSNWSSRGIPSGQLNNHFGHPTLLQSPPSAIPTQQRPFQGSEPLQYQHVAPPAVAPSSYASIRNPYSSIPVMSHVQSGEVVHQSVLSGYEVPYGNSNPGNKLANTILNYQSMTPQEKIEKLRRRQQIQAMLAIQQQQQQQFGHQASCSDQSSTQMCSKENQIHNVDGLGIEVEDLSAIASFHPNSPAEQDNANTFSLAVEDHTLEHMILYRFQSIIAKTDLKVRLSIRDSLFRLAQSVIQRHYASDTGSTNNSGKDEHVLMKEETGSHGNAKIPEAETETNPIDRAVAHLLFHRPLEISGTTHQEVLESPNSGTVGVAKFSMVALSGTPKNQQFSSHQGPKSTCQSIVDPKPITQCKTTGLCVETSDNASNNGPSENASREAAASQ